MTRAPLPPGGRGPAVRQMSKAVYRLSDMPGDQSQEQRRLPRERLGAAGVIARLTREFETLREENQRLRIALRGYDEPVSPFPLLPGAEIRRILHPEGGVQPATNKFDERARTKRAIARVTHEFARQARPAAEIKAAVLAEAERGGFDPHEALAISASIIREKVAEGHYA
jgi:hypothetical protein